MGFVERKNKILMYANIIERNLIWIILISSAVALFQPLLFIGFKPYITVFVAILLFGIGFTFDKNDFNKVWEIKGKIILAILAKYLLMSSTAYLISQFLHLSSTETIGLVILGSCPGGVAAAVMSYLSRGNVALTVVLTFGTTIIAPLAMPGLIYLFLYKEITIPFWQVAGNTLLIVFVPLVLGVTVRKCFSRGEKIIARIFPTLSIIVIGLAIACIISLAQQEILAFPFWIISAAILLNLFGYGIGYIISKILNCEKREQKAIVFEYGIFDVPLGLVIANNFFGPAAALPGVFMSVIQNTTASIIVKYLMRPTKTALQYSPVKIKD